MAGYLTLNGERLTAVRLRMPARGAWVAEADFESDPPALGRCSLGIGALVLSGSVVDTQAGAFGKQRRLRLVAGGGGWGSLASSRSYHNDAGIKARLLAEDLAREAGEQLGEFAAELERVGVDYVRGATLTCATVLEDVIGAVAWWVDAAGVTHVGERPTAPALLETQYQILAFDPRERVATLSLDDPSLLAIGTRLVGPSLAEPLTVREYQIQADAAGVRVFAWCGSDTRSAGRLSGLWRAVTERSLEQRLFGLYLYRVVAMASDNRVSLQAVHRSAGLPDIEPVPQWPGAPGIHTELAPGGEVLVAFIEGDRTRPAVTHYAGQGATGFVPTGVVIGGADGLPCARQTDTVEVLLPPSVITGTLIHPTLGVMPLTGVLTYPNSVTLGSIVTGSSVVKVAPP